MSIAINLPMPSVTNLDRVVSKGNFLFLMGISSDYESDWINAYTEDNDVRIYDHLLTVYTDMSENSVVRLITAHFSKFDVVSVKCKEIEESYLSVIIKTREPLDTEIESSIEWVTQ